MKHNRRYRMLAVYITALLAVQNLNGIMINAAQDPVYPCGDLEITYTVTGEWENCQNVQLTVTNPTDAPVSRWAIAYDAGGIITDIWNANVVESKDTEYVISNASYNNCIMPHSSQEFGYIVSWGESRPEVTAFTNCIERVAADGGYEVTSAIQGNPESGNGVISVTNTSENPIYGWELSFLSDTPIYDCYDAALTGNNESSYTISYSPWNAVILPGNTLNLGVSADFSASDEFQISDIALTTDVLAYSFAENYDSSLQLGAFSEYGYNILHWNTDTNAAFDIYRQDGSNEPVCIDTIQGSMYYIDTEAVPGTTYTYYVAANNPEEETVQSNAVQVTTSGAPDGEVTEVPRWYTDMMQLDEDFSALQIGYAAGDSRNYVSRHLTLPASGAHGSTVIWKSSDPQVISESGEVTAPYSDQFTPVTMHAFLTLGEFTVCKKFDLSVAPKANVDPTVRLSDTALMELNDGDMPSMTYNVAEGNVSKIEGVCSSVPVFSSEGAFAVLCALSDYLGYTDPASELEFVHYESGLSNNVFTFRQVYEGVPVIGYGISVYTDPETGIVRRIANPFHSQLSLETVEPAVSAEEVTEIIAAQVHANVTGEPMLVVYYPLVEEGEISAPLLAWYISTDSVPADTAVVDAMTGEVLETSDVQYFNFPGNYTDESNPNIKLEDGETLTINTERVTELFLPDQCYLHDCARGLRLYNGYGQTSADNWTVFVRNDEDWSDPCYDNAIAAEFQVSKAFDYFDRTFGWKGFDNNAGNTEMKIGVDYWKKKKDGTIDQTVSNAFSNNGVLGFGSGNGSTTISVTSSLDFVAHEFTHSVTRQHFLQRLSASMPYQGECGAINEAYSDIFAEFVDPKYDWHIGIEYHTDGSSTRDLTNPAAQIYQGANWTDTSDYDNDNGGVHNNSTVLSHAAYLMTLYDSATGLGAIPKKELEKIWFESYKYYDTCYPVFQHCREAVEAAADYLYGSESAYARKVRSAFDAAGVQKTDLTVRIEDAVTGNIIKGAEVKLTSPYYTYRELGTNRRCIFTNSHGEAYFEGIFIAGKLTFDVRSGSYEPLTQVVTADTAVRYYTFQLETAYDKSLKGTITIADTDTDMTNNAPLDSCKLKLTKLSGSGKINGELNCITTYTDPNGNYEFKDIPFGQYELVAERIGYIPVHQIITVRTSVTTYNFAIELIKTSYDGKGYASGTITDARTGAMVPDLTLHVYRGIYVGSDEPASSPAVCTITTNANGKYLTPELSTGNYTVFVLDNRAGISASGRYLTSSFAIKVMKDQVIANQNGTVSQTLEDDQLRIVLTWGASPKDLDSHTVISTQSGTQKSHISYGHKRYYVASGIATELDLDDTVSYGPETTTIYIPNGMKYHFYVHDYTNRLAGRSSTALANSGAKVYVYSGNSTMPIEVFSVPSGTGIYWDVFTYNAETHEIIPHDTIVSYVP